MAGPPDPAVWGDYLRDFHAERAGITEVVLRRCRADDGLDPYEWCAAALGEAPGPVLDVAAGSGPLADHLPRWVGLDPAPAELASARAQGRTPLVAARAEALPLASGSIRRAACSMAWQVLSPLDGAVAELARVLADGGQVALLLPAAGPLGARSAAAYLAAQVALVARIGYPNDARLRPAALAELVDRHGVAVRADEARAFSFALHDGGGALVRSLYLPGVPERRRPRAARLLRLLAGPSIDVPLRRVLLERVGPDDAAAGRPGQDGGPSS
jgi:SAM-dependent methyltransferase